MLTTWHWHTIWSEMGLFFYNCPIRFGRDQFGSLLLNISHQWQQIRVLLPHILQIVCFPLTFTLSFLRKNDFSQCQFYALTTFVKIPQTKALRWPLPNHLFYWLDIFLRPMKMSVTNSRSRDEFVVKSARSKTCKRTSRGRNTVKMIGHLGQVSQLW